MEIEKSYEELFNVREIRILFQPIVDLRACKIHGYEALARGVNFDNEVVSPYELFERAKMIDESLRLDRLCRKRAFEEYCKFENYCETKIFINIDSSVLSDDIAGSKWLFRASKDCGLKPENVVVEFSEKKFLSTNAMLRVTESLKSDGFKIALDDFGAAFSNLGRLIDIDPDYIKIDRKIIKGIDFNLKKQYIIEALSLLASRLNVKIVAEGVERAEEIALCRKFDIELYQGYLIGYPSEERSEVDFSKLFELINNTKL